MTKTFAVGYLGSDGNYHRAPFWSEVGFLSFIEYARGNGCSDFTVYRLTEDLEQYVQLFKIQ